MSFDPSLAEPRDVSRFWLGDWGEVELLTDDQYDASLSAYGLEPGTAFLADGLAAKYAQQPDRVTLPSGLSVAWSERVKAWAALALRLRTGQGLGAGGISMVGVTYGAPDPTDEFARPLRWWP